MKRLLLALAVALTLNACGKSEDADDTPETGPGASDIRAEDGERRDTTSQPGGIPQELADLAYPGARPEQSLGGKATEYGEDFAEEEVISTDLLTTDSFERVVAHYKQRNIGDEPADYTQFDAPDGRIAHFEGDTDEATIVIIVTEDATRKGTTIQIIKARD